ncbi:MAG: hypothetical protein VW894_02850 [Gammaproteobacteria bacterium]
MGISLGDIASFATGVVDADEKATQERLVDRREELRADRQFYIDMKTKKYESDLKNFEEQDKKYKAIQSVNAQFAGQEKVDPSAYGRAYLQETNPNLLLQYETLYAENPQLLNSKLSAFGNSSIRDFKTTTTRDTLDNKLKADVEAITAKYKKDLEFARGDSKLINAIIGKRDKEIADTIQENEDGKSGTLKAKEIAVESDTESKPSFTFGEVKEVAVPPTKAFKDEASKLRIKLNDNTEIKKENVNIALTFFDENQIDVPKQFLVKDTDGNTTGLKGSGNTFINQTNSLANQAVKTFSDDKLNILTNKEKSLISNEFNPNVINGMVSERLSSYSTVSTEKKNGFFGGRDNIVAIVPFSIVDSNNVLGNYQFTNKAQTKAVGEAYLQALKNIDATNNPDGSIESSEKYMNDLQKKLLTMNPDQETKESKAVKDEVIRILTEKNIIQTTENTTDAPTDNNLTSEVSVGKIKIKHNESGETKIVDDTTENRNLLDGEKFSLVEEAPKEEVKSDVVTSANETRVDEDTDKGMLDETRIQVLTNLANTNNISDEELLEFGDMVKLNQVPRNLRTRLFKLKMDRQKKKNDERRANFNKKVEEINKNKNTTTAQNQDE